MNSNKLPRISKANTAHLYSIEVKLKDGTKGQVDVEGNNRNQAASLAKKAGYEVCSVNMVG